MKHKIMIHVSVGELLDKVSILLIKEEFCQGSKLKAVQKELSLLMPQVEALGEQALYYIRELNRINRIIWALIDRQTELISSEPTPDQQKELTTIAKEVVIYNQERFRFKQKADSEFESELQEVKQHAKPIPRPELKS